MLVNLEDPASKPDRRIPLLQLGFRPFFLLAGLAACLLLLLWGLIYHDSGSAPNAAAMRWHGHEMVFGYTSAVIAGFLLTAVKNWTGRQTLQGLPLLVLSLLWLLGRIAPFTAEIILPVTAALVDLLFLPVLAVVTAYPLLKTANYRNLVFVVILILLAGSNLVFHLGTYGIIPAGNHTGLYGGIYLILLLISVMGGRVIPFFIERGLSVNVTRRPFIDGMANLSMLLLATLHLTGADSTPVAMAALLGAALQGLRLAGWYDHGVWRVPLLWVLVTAYAWLVLGLFLTALAMLGAFPLMQALHAMTIGGIGLLTMGMMVRVSLGHSGRPLHAPLLLTVAFATLNIAALVRVFLPVLSEDGYSLSILLATVLWVGAYLAFMLRMVKVYLAARVDGRPG